MSTFIKPKFTDMVKSGRSLIITETRSAATRVRELLKECYWSRLIFVEGPADIAIALKCFDSPATRPDGQLIMLAGSAIHGFRVDVDRVIWISPATHSYPVTFVDGRYVQGMARGDMPWGQPAKWNYSEAELFD